MAEQPPNPNPEPERPPRRADFASTPDWWDAHTPAQQRDYIERNQCPPHGAMRGWSGPQDPGFSNG